MDLAIAALMIENVPEAKRQRKTHARCRLEPKMGALRKLITEANNGSGDEFNPFNESLKLACFQRYI